MMFLASLISLPTKSARWLFFGPYCLMLGYLIFRSTFLPRILGVLMALAGFAGLGWLTFLSPLANYLSTYLKVLGFLAEASLMLWLIGEGREPSTIKGAGQRSNGRVTNHSPPVPFLLCRPSCRAREILSTLYAISTRLSF